MAENQYNSKIVLSSGEVLMDLTQDTVVADKLLKGFTAHGKDGAPITGSCEFDADTGDATAGAAEILAGKTAYVTGSKVTGTMPNNGAKTLNITEKGKRKRASRSPSPRATTTAAARRRSTQPKRRS